jgi:hypothetical protein
MTTPATDIAINLAKLAREIAMDVQPLDKLLTINEIDLETWDKIQADTNFQSMLRDMVVEWNAASNARARIRVKSQTAIEMLIDTLIAEVFTGDAPLTQKVDAVRQIARLGELEAKEIGGGAAGDRVTITINMGDLPTSPPPIIIDALPNKEDD